MSEQLRECPHCGATRGLYTLDEYGGLCVDDDLIAQIFCDNCKSAFENENANNGKELIEAWNTRAERTCKFESDIINTAWDENDNEIETGEVADEADMYCGNCGYRMIRDDYDGWWDEEPGPYGGRFLAPRFNYCPKCGSKVIDWDGRKAVS